MRKSAIALAIVPVTVFALSACSSSGSTSSSASPSASAMTSESASAMSGSPSASGSASPSNAANAQAVATICKQSTAVTKKYNRAKKNGNTNAQTRLAKTAATLTQKASVVATNLADAPQLADQLTKCTAGLANIK